MNSITNKTTEGQDSFKSAHFLSEFSKVLLNLGEDMDNSVSLFDSIGEKNDLFIKFEKSINSPIDSLIEMHTISKNGIYHFVFNNFVNIFRKHSSRFNFIHVAESNSNEIIFFISTKDDEIKEVLSKNEFEYSTGDLSNYLRISFCFLEADMEKELNNTKKIALNVEELRK